MAAEAGKLLELLSIDNIVESYQVIQKMQPADLLKRLESENVSTNGHMPELRARLLRLQLRQCHSHAQVPWYAEDGVFTQKDDDEEVIVEIEEQSQIQSILERLELVQKDLEACKLRCDLERTDDSLRQDEQSFESVESVRGSEEREEDSNTSSSSDSDSSDSETDNDVEASDISGEVDVVESDAESNKSPEPTVVSRYEAPDVATDDKKAECFINQDDWVQKKWESLCENQKRACDSSTPQAPTTNKSMYVHPTPASTEQKTSIAPPVWSQMMPGQNKLPYPPTYQPYPSPDPLMTFRDPRVHPSYFTPFQPLPNPVFVPANPKPYWL